MGSAALGVAAARAAETDSENPLIRDPFARVFLEAAGDGMWSLMANPAKAAELTDDADLLANLQVLIDFMAVRTAFFDEYFLNAAASGVRQVVILAAGLDARAWRLPWPDGTTVYELDQAKVLDFKSTALQRRGAHPTSELVSVAIDLRQDWPTALQQAGFDPSQPGGMVGGGAAAVSAGTGAGSAVRAHPGVESVRQLAGHQRTRRECAGS